MFENSEISELVRVKVIWAGDFEKESNDKNNDNIPPMPFFPGDSLVDSPNKYNLTMQTSLRSDGASWPPYDFFYAGLCNGHPCDGSGGDIHDATVSAQYDVGKPKWSNYDFRTNGIPLEDEIYGASPFRWEFQKELTYYQWGWSGWGIGGGWKLKEFNFDWTSRAWGPNQSQEGRAAFGDQGIMKNISMGAAQDPTNDFRFGIPPWSRIEAWVHRKGGTTSPVTWVDILGQKQDLSCGGGVDPFGNWFNRSLWNCNSGYLQWEQDYLPELYEGRQPRYGCIGTPRPEPPAYEDSAICPECENSGERKDSELSPRGSRGCQPIHKTYGNYKASLTKFIICQGVEGYYKDKCFLVKTPQNTWSDTEPECHGYLGDESFAGLKPKYQPGEEITIHPIPDGKSHRDENGHLTCLVSTNEAVYGFVEDTCPKDEFGNSRCAGDLVSIDLTDWKNDDEKGYADVVLKERKDDNETVMGSCGQWMHKQINEDDLPYDMRDVGEDFCRDGFNIQVFEPYKCYPAKEWKFEVTPCQDRVYARYVFCGWEDVSARIRIADGEGGGGGGVPAGFEEKCITLCDEGEEVEGKILFKAEPCEEENIAKIINTVVHVFDNGYDGSGGTGWVSDQAVIDEITSLNTLFWENNPQAKIQFKLNEIKRIDWATQIHNALAGDPRGNGALEGEDTIKVTDKGGSDPVDVNKNLNIWIIPIANGPLRENFSGGATAWAYYPSDAAGTYLDGVVLTSNWFGSPKGQQDCGPALCGGEYGWIHDVREDGAPVYSGEENKAHALAHEIGHYLSLPHVWGDGGGGCGTENDDGIADTNEQDGMRFGCPTSTIFPLIDGEGDPHDGTSCGTPDPIDNYMNYTKQICKDKFTQDQIDRMDSALEIARPDIYEEVKIKDGEQPQY